MLRSGVCAAQAVNRPGPTTRQGFVEHVEQDRCHQQPFERGVTVARLHVQHRIRFSKPCDPASIRKVGPAIGTRVLKRDITKQADQRTLL